jgi:hypothetical protein
MSIPREPGPELIAPALIAHPRANSRRAVLMAGAAFLAIASVGGFWGVDRQGPRRGFDRQAPGRDQETIAAILAGSSATGIIAPINSSQSDQVAAAIRLLQLNDAEKEKIASEVRAGRLRLGVLVVADWLDDDDDLIAITSAGFTQTTVIKLEPHPVVVPYEAAAASIAVTGVKDGGDGGVELAIGLPGRLTRLRPLLVGETVQVGLP